MILRPIAPADHSTTSRTPEPQHCVPVWEAIASTQQRPAEAWWLIAQPDHAALSGAMAAAFAAPGFPRVDPLIAKAIGLHDAGWAIFPGEASVTAPPWLHPDGRPLCFYEIAPADFLQAWRRSIQIAEQTSAAGGFIISRHFAWLGEYRLTQAPDAPAIKAQVAAFVEQERRRQERLGAGLRLARLEDFVRVLQFCDLLSLYLCCGSEEAVEFPQEFAAGRVRLWPRDGGFQLQPSPLADGGLSLAVEARRYPRAVPATRQLAFLIW